MCNNYVNFHYTLNITNYKLKTAEGSFSHDFVGIEKREIKKLS